MPEANLYTQIYNPFQRTASGGGSPYNFNPSPQTYSGTFGGVPGPVGAPQPFQDLSSVYPNLSGTNAALSGDIYNQMQAMLSPGTQQRLQDAAAAWTVHSGMPSRAPIGTNKALRDLGLAAENQVVLGENAYRGIIPTVSSTQTLSPTTQADIAAHNAAVNAAPNPAQAQTYAAQLFDKYLQQIRGPAAATGSSPQDIVQHPSGALGFGFNTLGQPTAPPSTTTDLSNPAYYPDWATFDYEQMFPDATATSNDPSVGIGP